MINIVQLSNLYNVVICSCLFLTAMPRSTPELFNSSYILVEPTPSISEHDSGTSSVLSEMYTIIILVPIAGALLCVLFAIVSCVVMVARRGAWPRNKNSGSVRQNLHLTKRGRIPVHSNLCYGSGNLLRHENDRDQEQHLPSFNVNSTLYYCSTNVLNNQRNQILGSESDHVYNDILNYPIQRNANSDRLPPSESAGEDDSSQHVYENSMEKLTLQTKCSDSPVISPQTSSVVSNGYVNTCDGPPKSHKYANIDSLAAAVSHSILPCTLSMDGSQDYEIPVKQC